MLRPGRDSQARGQLAHRGDRKSQAVGGAVESGGAGDEAEADVVAIESGAEGVAVGGVIRDDSACPYR